MSPRHRSEICVRMPDLYRLRRRRKLFSLRLLQYRDHNLPLFKDQCPKLLPCRWDHHLHNGEDLLLCTLTILYRPLFKRKGLRHYPYPR